MHPVKYVPRGQGGGGGGGVDYGGRLASCL